MGIKLANNLKTTLASGITSGATTLTVSAGAGALFPTLTIADWSYITIIDQSTFGTDSEILEIVKVTDVTGDVLTIERASDDSIARAAIVGDIIQMRGNKQTLIDLGGGVGTPTYSREYIEFFPLSITGRPPLNNVGAINDHANIYGRKFFNDWDTYWGPNIKCLIEDKTNGTTWDDLSFPTKNDIANWVTANVPIDGSSNSTANFILKPYETIDHTIPAISYINGYNRFFTSLAGGDTRSSRSHTAVKCMPLIDNCVDMFNSLGLGGAPVTAADGLDLLQSVWLGRAKKNIYGKAPLAVSINSRYNVYFPGGVSNRRVRDVITDTYLNNSAPGEYYAVGNVMYSYLNANSMTGGVHDSDMTRLTSIIDGGSAVVFVGVESGNHRAMVVKPIGMDTIKIELFNENLYDFEVVATQSDVTTGVNVKSYPTHASILAISGGATEEIDAGFGKMLINTSVFVSPFIDLDTIKFGIHATSNVRFRLREKATGRVSVLSTSGVVFKHGRDIYGSHFMVEPIG